MINPNESFPNDSFTPEFSETNSVNSIDENIQFLTITAIKQDTALKAKIMKARMDEIEAASLGNTKTKRFKAFSQIWNYEEIEMVIDAFMKNNPQFLFNMIAATWYLSLWPIECHIHGNSALFKQRMLYRAAFFTSKLERKLRLITALKDSSSNWLATNQFTLTKLRIFSLVIPALDTHIKMQEGSFPFVDYELWTNNERKLVSLSFEDASKHYQEMTGNFLSESDLKTCIDEFLEDIL